MALTKRSLLVIVGKVHHGGNPAIGGGPRALGEGVGGNRVATYQMIVGMRIDDTGKNRKPVGPDDLHRTVNLTDLDLRSDPNDDSILDQDIRMPGPLGIHQQTLGNQKSFHTPRILPGEAIGNIAFVWHQGVYLEYTKRIEVNF